MAPIDRHAKSRLRMLHAQRGTGQPETSRPSLRSGLTAYVVLSPGSDALLPPSPCGWLTRLPGRAAHITARLGAQTPGARTTRFCRTPITPVVCATPPLTVARPAKAIRADVTCVHRRPARVRDDRDTPLFLGPGCGDIYAVSEFRQSGIFSARRLDRWFGCFACQATQGIVPGDSPRCGRLRKQQGR